MQDDLCLRTNFPASLDGLLEQCGEVRPVVCAAGIAFLQVRGTPGAPKHTVANLVARLYEVGRSPCVSQLLQGIFRIGVYLLL